MHARDPVYHLARALGRATTLDLLCVAGTSTRPNRDACEVAMFNQCWSAVALGEPAGPGAGSRELDTIVVVGPSQDACVYAGPRLLYHVQRPNRRFFLDVAAHAMAAPADAACYEGRDDSVTESVDIELAALLARLQAQVQAGEPHRAALVASYLRRCAKAFDAQVPHAVNAAWGGIERRRAWPGVRPGDA